MKKTNDINAYRAKVKGDEQEKAQQLMDDISTADLLDFLTGKSDDPKAAEEFCKSRKALYKYGL